MESELQTVYDFANKFIRDAHTVTNSLSATKWEASPILSRIDGLVAGGIPPLARGQRGGLATGSDFDNWKRELESVLREARSAVEELYRLGLVAKGLIALRQETYKQGGKKTTPAERKAHMEAMSNMQKRYEAAVKAVDGQRTKANETLGRFFTIAGRGVCLPLGRSAGIGNNVGNFYKIFQEYMRESKASPGSMRLAGLAEALKASPGWNQLAAMWEREGLTLEGNAADVFGMVTKKRAAMGGSAIDEMSLSEFSSGAKAAADGHQFERPRLTFDYQKRQVIPPVGKQSEPNDDQLPTQTKNSRNKESQKTPAKSGRRIPREEAEILVRDWLQSHAKDDPAAIKRDDVAKHTGVSLGGVSKTVAWRAFEDRRKAEAKPKARDVQFSDRMEAMIPSGNLGSAGSVQRNAVINQLIQEGSEEEAEQERRHKNSKRRVNFDL